jgi:hypothetical protein
VVVTGSLAAGDWEAEITRPAFGGFTSTAAIQSQQAADAQALADWQALEAADPGNNGPAPQPNAGDGTAVTVVSFASI